VTREPVGHRVVPDGAVGGAVKQLGSVVGKLPGPSQTITLLAQSWELARPTRSAMKMLL